MRFARIATFFDMEPVLDGYTGEYLFKCQFSSFDDHQSSGATARRRTLTLDPNIVMPDRKVIEIFDGKWVVGNHYVDGFQGEAIRTNYNLKSSSGLFSILTPAEACLSANGVTAYAHMTYFRDVPDTVTTSEYYPFWNVFFPDVEVTAVRANFVRLGSTLYRIRSNYISEDGYQLAQCDELAAGSVVAVSITNNGAYNVVTETYPTVSINTFGIHIEMTKFYVLKEQIQEYEKPGDMTLFLPASAVTPTAAMRLTIVGKPWKVLTFTPVQDAWALTVRPV